MLKRLWLCLFISAILCSNVTADELIKRADQGTKWYCNARSENCGGEYISRVVVGDIDKSSTCDGYGFFVENFTEMYLGVSYALTVYTGSGQSYDHCKVWVDWNRDQVIDEVAEAIDMSPIPGAGPYTGTIKVPVDAVTGMTLLRVRLGSDGSFGPCGNTVYGDVEDYRLDLFDPPPYGACCVGSACSITDGADCVDNLGGVYSGDGTECLADACIGACCDGAVCTITDADDCELAIGGEYSGNGSTCTPNPCVGACCFTNGSCSIATESECNTNTGSFLGEGTDCQPNECPQPCGCPATISSYPHCQNFDVSNGYWSDSVEDDFNWTRTTGSTPSLDTGPTGDHTSGSGIYLFTEATGHASETAIMESPCYDLSSLNSPELTFWYNMFGATTGTLSVEVSADGCVSWDPVWSLSGDQGTSWHMGVIDLSSYVGETIRVRIIGLVGNGYTSDMAIDDVCLGEAVQQVGACCDVATGACNGTAAMTEVECQAYAGSDWHVGQDCYGSFSCPLPPPGNDLCSDATVIDSLPFADQYVNYGDATPDIDVSCNSSSCMGTNHGVWYRYTPTSDCRASINVQGATTEEWTVAAVFTGPDCDNLSQIACNDDLITSITVSMSAGTQYWILVGRWGCASSPAGDLNITFDCVNGACCGAEGTCSITSPTGCSGTYVGDGVSCDPNPCSTGACCAPDGCHVVSSSECSTIGGVYQGDSTSCTISTCRPVNDDCDSAEPVGEVTALEFDTTKATLDGPGLCQGSRNIWYSYTPTCTGRATVSLCGSSYDTKLATYDGGTCTPMANLSRCNDDNGPSCSGEQSSTVMDVIAGQSYLIEIGGYSGAFGLGQMTISCTEADLGACCTDAPACSIEYKLVCERDGGLYGGDNTDCGGDCDSDGISDVCELLAGDCNDNRIPDDCDIDAGTSTDYNDNDIPDECDRDCNTNGIPDECDVSCAGSCGGLGNCGASLDCQPDGIPDECQLGTVAPPAQLLMLQPVIPDDNGPGGLVGLGSSCPYTTTAADDFTLAVDASITEVSWVGFYFGPGNDWPGADSGFRITIYKDNGAGNSGAIVADFNAVAVEKESHCRSAVDGMNPVYAYRAGLPHVVPVIAGQRYWISINGNPGGAGGPVFGWMTSHEGNAALIPGNDQPLQRDDITCASLPVSGFSPGGPGGDLDSDLAFGLTGYIGDGGDDCNGNAVPDECDDLNGDFDDDGDVDLNDFAAFADCLSGPAKPVSAVSEGCRSLCLAVFDIDEDGDVDLVDFAAFQGLF